MYACYVDESGHCGRKFNADQPVEVLCGVYLDLSKLPKTQKEQRHIIGILNDNNIPVDEFKASHIYRGDGAWAGVTPKLRKTVMELLLNWGKGRYCKFVICPIDSKKFFDLKSDGCEISSVLKYPYEAGALKVVASIQRMNRSKKNNKGNTVVILDEQGKHDINLLSIFGGDLSFTDDYTEFKQKPRAKIPLERFSQIVDVPHFSKSHLSKLIQIADVGAFIVNRYLQLTVYESEERYDGELKQITKWYDLVGECLVPTSAFDPTGKGLLKEYYRQLRPTGWTGKKWNVG